jgi:hypothetical protein
MKKYIGTKILLAVAMTLGAYNESKGWTIPANEDPNREGYQVAYEDGYVSWSPKEVFESSYRQTSGMNFGLAMEAAKAGKAVARAGWNGKNMFVWMTRGSVDFLNVKEGTISIEGVSIAAFDRGDEGTVTRLPHLNMRTPSGSTVTGWLASQTDILADDWSIIEE